MALLGVHHISTTAYHPSSNGLVERFHRQLKASLIAREAQTSWVDHLPVVMLGIRSAFKEDLSCTAAELVYGTTLRLPGDFWSDPDGVRSLPQAEYVQQLRRFFRGLAPVPSRTPPPSKVFLHPDLNTSTHVFLRHDAVRKPLSPHYDGPYRVLSRNSKTFTIDIAGQRQVVSLGRLKPAYLAAVAPAPPLALEDSSPALSPPKPRRRVTWAAPLRVPSPTSPPL
ncbi:uncharacterized protein LOC135374070 [Ornithodoros turicata]|uniref:uncharacterized protein LOC135374070 n=1 Tax=Ornithodoros turicata TaxID=34597 RepID=UPI003139A32E